ncbi:hypothetical protein SISSUDRAFT_1043667, partial [Sistotremastrum suecicum HHB10207 ss-3]
MQVVVEQIPSVLRPILYHAIKETEDALRCLNIQLERLSVDGVRLFDPMVMTFYDGIDARSPNFITAICAVLFATISWPGIDNEHRIATRDWQLAVREGSRGPSDQVCVDVADSEVEDAPFSSTVVREPNESFIWSTFETAVEIIGGSSSPIPEIPKAPEPQNQTIDLDDIDEGPARMGLLFKNDQAQIWYRKSDGEIISSESHSWHEKPIWFINVVLALTRLSRTDLASDYGIGAEDPDKRTVTIRTLSDQSIEIGLVIDFQPPPIPQYLCDRGPYTWTTRYLGEGITFEDSRFGTYHGAL